MIFYRKMYAKNKFCLKYILAVLVLSFAIQCVSSDIENGEDAAVEVEETDPVVEIPYSSPSPSGNYYLAENFDDVDKFRKKWIQSQAKKEGIDEELAKYDGIWEIEGPQRDGLRSDLGLVLKSKAKHAAISAKLDKPFHFVDKPLIVQYEVNFQEGQECGGAYLKLLSQSKETTDLKQFFDKTPYTIMFGPDKCGNDFKLHFIFRHRNPKNGTYEEKHCKKPKDRINEPFEDRRPHLYTLIVKPDNSFEVRIDHKVVNKGSLLEDFTPPVNPEPEIDDPEDVKPSNWDEREKIPDPDAKKPEDWDESAPAKIVDPFAKKPDDWLEDEPLMIPDPDAEKPEDWDADMDGEWEAPLVENPACVSVSGCGPWTAPKIDNPAYKGKWIPPMIDNPNYQGIWKPRRIPNPNYFVDDTPFRMTTISAVGFELWSMSASIFFDNILITDSIMVAEDYAAKSFDLKKRKIDQDSVTLYGKIMRSINYKPGWWALYGFYCSIPLVAYCYYLYTRAKEGESVLTKILKYSNERPYMYAVYIVVIGLPIALLFVFCCGESKKESSEAKKEADAKKTDAYTPDDVSAPEKSKGDADIPEDNAEDDDVVGEENVEDEEAGGDENADEDDGDDGDATPEDYTSQKSETGQGDVRSSPRKRKPLKE